MNVSFKVSDFVRVNRPVGIVTNDVLAIVGRTLGGRIVFAMVVVYVEQRLVVAWGGQANDGGGWGSADEVNKTLGPPPEHIFSNLRTVSFP